MKISIDEIDNVEVEGVGNLHTIIQHYCAIPYLVEGIKENKNAFKILSSWDHARGIPVKKTVTGKK